MSTTTPHIPDPVLDLSGERFTAVYRLTAPTEAEARELAENAAVEQTVEFPLALVPRGDIRQQIVARVEAFAPAAPGPHGPAWEATLSFAVEAAGTELTQLLNMFLGNTSMTPGVRLERFDLPRALTKHFPGPRFGQAGLRERLGVPDKPLLCSALKPLGLSAQDLADMAYEMALGGIDIIKDDHGLTDQRFAPFSERVARCVEAVARANRETGGRSIYMPHVTAPADRQLDRAREAARLGAGGVLYSPGLGGFDAMRQLAADDAVGIPIMSHPALLGSFLTSGHSGLSHHALFGQLMRLAGADASVYPNYGGRFATAFTRDDCRDIAAGCTVDMGTVKPAFPTPGGGLTLDRVPDAYELYGEDVIFLIGGGLFTRGPDLADNCRYFRGLIGRE